MSNRDKTGGTAGGADGREGASGDAVEVEGRRDAAGMALRPPSGPDRRGVLSGRDSRGGGDDRVFADAGANAATPATADTGDGARGGAAPQGAGGRHDGADPGELGPRMGGIALKNGLILLTERFWSVAVRETDGTITVASGKKVQVPGSGGSGETAGPPGGAGGARAPGTRLGARARPGAGAGAGRRAGGRGGTGLAAAGIPLLRGLGRFGESLLVLAAVKARLPQAQLPIEGGRVAAALAASLAATSAVKAVAPKSAFVQETGAALASFLPAVLAVKNSAISGYHGAEHKVIGGRETALRAAAEAQRGARGRAAAGGEAAGGEATGVASSGESAAARGVVCGDSAAATKEHDRCGSNLVGPYLLATIATNVLARGRSGRKTPVASAAAGAASLALALEALRWSNKHADSILARLMLSPGRAIQKVLTTSEPTAQQLEVGERALAELMRLENA